MSDDPLELTFCSRNLESHICKSDESSWNGPLERESHIHEDWLWTEFGNEKPGVFDLWPKASNNRETRRETKTQVQRPWRINSGAERIDTGWKTRETKETAPAQGSESHAQNGILRIQKLSVHNHTAVTAVCTLAIETSQYSARNAAWATPESTVPSRSTLDVVRNLLCRSWNWSRSTCTGKWNW